LTISSVKFSKYLLSNASLEASVKLLQKLMIGLNGKRASMDNVQHQAASHLRIALVHYWIVGVAGGEKVVQSLLKLYPHADIFTLLYDPQAAEKVVGKRKITASFMQKIPRITRIYRSLLPIMPIAIENIDVSGYDLIISSESGPAKGVLPGIGAVQVCYCHSPMRYIGSLRAGLGVW